MKEISKKLNLIKIKKHLLCRRQCQENKKTSHRMGENSYKKDTFNKRCIPNIQRTLKSQQ